MISVIIPTYNRKENLSLCLAALEQQEYRFFEVIVADDGSTDGTAELLRDKDSIAGIPFKYYSAGPNIGFRAGRARNIGAANSHPDSSLFVFIDSDNVMPPNILGRYAELHEQYPQCIIVGFYHFLIRMDFSVENLRNDEDFWFRLATLNYPRLPMPPDGSLKGRKDPRYDDCPDTLEPETFDTGIGLASALGCFSGNIGYPKEVFWDIGGFWEELVGHGGEDAALALAAVEKGHSFLRVKDLVGYHVWHERYVASEAQMVEELNTNIDKIDRRFRIGKYAEYAEQAAIDCTNWSDPRHYHKDRGSRLVCDDNNTCWVVVGKHRLGLSTPEALEKVGWGIKDADPIDLQHLEKFAVEGVI